MKKHLCPNCSADVPLEWQVKDCCGTCGGALSQTPLQRAAARLAAVQAGMPVPEKTTSAPPLPLFLDCLCCGHPTGNLKCYPLGTVFLLFGVAWSFEDELGCPRCIRRKLLYNSLVNLLTAHVLCPLAIWPNNLLNLVSSFWPGHSLKVRDYLVTAPADRPRDTRPDSSDIKPT